MTADERGWGRGDGRSRMYRHGSTLICGFVLLCSVARGTELRVKPGDDVDAVSAGLKPGDVLAVEPGIYTQAWTFARLQGDETAPVIIRGMEGTLLRPVKPKGNDGRDGILLCGGCKYVNIENLRIEGAARGGIIVSGSGHITIRNCVLASNGIWGIQTCLSDRVAVENCEVYGSKKEHGIYFSTTDHPVARNCRIHDNPRCGIHLNGDRKEGGDGMISEGLIERNIIYANGLDGGAGINMDGVEKTVVRDNIICNNSAGGVVNFARGGARVGSGNEFSNNTVYFKPGEGRFALSLQGEAENTLITSNILIAGKSPAMYLAGPEIGLVSDWNVFWANGSEFVISFGGRAYTLPQWQDRSGQDSRSTVQYRRWRRP